MKKPLLYSVVLTVCAIFCTNTALTINTDAARKSTDGIGVFTVTVNNLTDHAITTIVGVTLAGYVEKTRELALADTVTIFIDAHSSAQTLLVKPLVGSWPNYKGQGPDLADGSTIKVFMDIGPQQQSFYYPANYIPGTKLLEVQDTTFNIIGHTKKNNTVETLSNDSAVAGATTKSS